ncbi:T9SS type A sorting domain-containing protein, partial [bacterium]|nr:T9SS type A sorting domain-containing protein [bacterium]
DNDYYVLSSIINNVVIAKDGVGDFLWPRYNFSNMVPWRPGQGYQINVNEDVVLNYPEPLEREASITPGDNLDDNLRLYPHRTNVNMSILLYSINGRMLDNCRIVAFSGKDRLVGSGIINNGVCGLAVWGDDISTEEVDGLLEGEAFEIRLIDDSSGEQYRLSHSILEGDGLTYKTDDFTVLNATVGSLYVSDYQLLAAYPNPFNAVTRLSYQLPTATQVSINVYDLSGRLVDELVNCEKQAGKYDVFWNGENIVSGIYFVRMKTEHYNEIRKVTLIK